MCNSDVKCPSRKGVPQNIIESMHDAARRYSPSPCRPTSRPLASPLAAWPKSCVRLLCDSLTAPALEHALEARPARIQFMIQFQKRPAARRHSGGALDSPAANTVRTMPSQLRSCYAAATSRSHHQPLQRRRRPHTDPDITAFGPRAARRHATATPHRIPPALLLQQLLYHPHPALEAHGCRSVPAYRFPPYICSSPSSLARPAATARPRTAHRRAASTPRHTTSALLLQ